MIATILTIAVLLAFGAVVISVLFGAWAAGRHYGRAETTQLLVEGLDGAFNAGYRSAEIAREVTADIYIGGQKIAEHVATEVRREGRRQARAARRNLN